MLTQNSEQGYQRIHLAMLGPAFDKAKLNEVLVSQRGAVRYRDAYYVKSVQGEAWLFEYGILVSWNMTEDSRLALCHDLKPLIVGTEKLVASEDYSYSIDPGVEFSVRHDVLSLPDNEPLHRLALSHAFAQSHKLSFFESEAQSVIANNSYISKELASSGKVPLSRKELAKLRGVLFETSSDITLHFNLLDTPEFFWDYPELESYYKSMAKYLDLTPRIDILNRKLEIIREFLEVLASEQNHKHSAFLEWIIIVLIAVDIAVYFIGD